MTTFPLPEHASAETLAEQAELIEGLGVEDARAVVADQYGFDSWSDLLAHVEVVQQHSWTETDDRSHVDLVDRFVSGGCLTYGAGDPRDRIARAHALLDQDPALASASPAALAVVGDHRALAGRLDDDPELVDRPLRPNGWPLLLYATYSRIAAGDPAWSSVETARLLLDRGADPNAGFLWHGLVPPFTALTGAFGSGEKDQPPHADAFVLARLLLEAGADPNDGQALYNNGLAGTGRDDHRHLELLVEFGLGDDQGGPWYRRFGPRLTPPVELLYDELEVAAHRGHTARLVYLIGLGLDLRRPVGRSRLPPADIAARDGHEAIIHLLADAGVTPGPDSASDE